MKTLYLVRHAKSSWKHPELSDIDRPLNKRGKRDAPFMGKKLKEYNILPDLVISSPANRAITSAKIISSEIGYPEKKIEIREEIYYDTESTIVKLIRGTRETINELMLFGHNPDFTSIANYLCNSHVNNIPTCGVFCIEFDVKSWDDIDENVGRLKFFDFPKKFLI